MRIFNQYGISLANIEQFPNLTKKAVVQRVTEMVVDFLVQELDPAFSTGSIMSGDARRAGDAADKLIAMIPVEFWQDDWALKSLDTSAGRDIISVSIRELKKQIAKNQGDDFDWRKDNPLYQTGNQEEV